MKRILFVTGTRADFGKLKPLLKYVEQRSDIELHLVVTGMHMMKAYGSTYIEVLRENYKNIYLNANQFTGEPMGSILGNTIGILSRIFDEVDPDMVVVHGDRIEALAGASVGALSNRLVCHIEGGELSGTIDDSIRHSISKLSHVHLVANDSARNRLIQMGEPEKNIFIIGSPDLDIMQSKSLPSLESAKKHYEINFDCFSLSLFHPVTTECNDMESYAKQYFKALKESGKNYIVIYPNNDTGSKHIINEIEKVSSHANFRCFPSLRFESFLVFLKNSDFIIGNSSAGIREAPFYGIPTINVGTRQNKRSQHASIINCDYTSEQVLNAIQKSNTMIKVQVSNHFGKGNSVELFSKFIENPQIWNTEIQKSFVDL